MSNALYDYGRQRYLQGQFNWLTDNVQCFLVDTTVYSVNLAVHQYLSDVSTSAMLTSPVTLTGKATAAGAASAANVTFSAVTGNTAEAIILFVNTGTPATSPLICYIDTATGLPITPNGGDIIVTWDTGVNKIFKL